jgi:hypothetical protein
MDYDNADAHPLPNNRSYRLNAASVNARDACDELSWSINNRVGP